VNVPSFFPRQTGWYLLSSVCLLHLQKTPAKPGTGSNAAAAAGSSASSNAGTHLAVKQEPTASKDKPTQLDVRPGTGCKCLLLDVQLMSNVFILELSK